QHQPDPVHCDRAHLARARHLPHQAAHWPHRAPRNAPLGRNLGRPARPRHATFWTNDARLARRADRRRDLPRRGPRPDIVLVHARVTGGTEVHRPIAPRLDAHAACRAVM
ncbi:hypothetical protein GGF31_008968, partial [Allomyces arbusculus]